MDAEASGLHGSSEVRAFTTDLRCQDGSSDDARSVSAHTVGNPCNGHTYGTEDSHTFRDVLLVIPQDLAWLGVRASLHAFLHVGAERKAGGEFVATSEAHARMSFTGQEYAGLSSYCCLDLSTPDHSACRSMIGFRPPARARASSLVRSGTFGLGASFGVSMHANARALCTASASSRIVLGVAPWATTSSGDVVPLLRVISCSRADYLY